MGDFKAFLSISLSFSLNYKRCSLFLIQMPTPKQLHVAAAGVFIKCSDLKAFSVPLQHLQCSGKCELLRCHCILKQPATLQSEANM